MIYGSICSGIEAASVAWKDLPGWSCAFLSETDAFPRAVLEHRYPEVKLYGDFRDIATHQYVEKIDVLIGGTPCQSFSMAGNRAGLDDSRGNLTLAYARMVAAIRPQWFILENVPGLLTQAGGRGFSTVLAACSGNDQIAGAPWKWGKAGIIKPGGAGRYGIAWRVLDAQFFGVPQRRCRLFIVGHFGSWHPAATVLFVGESSGRCDTESTEAWEETAKAATRRSSEGRKLVFGGDKEACGTSGNNKPIILPTITTGAPYSGMGDKWVETEAIVIAPTQTNAEIGRDSMPTQSARQFKDPPLVFKERAGKPGGGKGLMSKIARSAPHGCRAAQTHNTFGV